MATTEKRANPSTEQESAAPESHAAVEFGREVCGSLEIAEQREWLVTNGIGGYASGTVSGDVTRCYHGVLVAALHPPAGRKAHLDAAGREHHLRPIFAAPRERPLSSRRESAGQLPRLSFPHPRWRLAHARRVRRAWNTNHRV